MNYLVKKNFLFLMIIVPVTYHQSNYNIEIPRSIKKKIHYAWATTKIALGIVGIAGLASMHKYYIDKYGINEYKAILDDKYNVNMRRKIEHWGLHLGGYLTGLITLVSGLQDIQTLKIQK